MTAPTLAWGKLLDATRGYLDLADDAPVPVDELKAQAKANGYTDTEVRSALRATDALENVGTVDTPSVVLASAGDESEDAADGVEHDRDGTSDRGKQFSQSPNAREGETSTSSKQFSAVPNARDGETSDEEFSKSPNAGARPGRDSPEVDTPEAPPESPDESVVEGGSGDETPGCEAGERGGRAGAWESAEFTAPEAGVWMNTLPERVQWMGRKEKLPFAPWGDRNADLECSHTHCPTHDSDTPEDVVDDCPDCQAHRDGTTTAKCAHDARYKWGHAGHYVDGERVAMAEDDPRLDGRVFIQRDTDPFAFVDGDDVRCPETGEVHPAFIEILDALGATYADVSTSGTGVHAYYVGELPDGQGQATFDIDTEPWGENDDVPGVEIYANKHVCVTTGEHVPGTSLDVVEWDAEALTDVLEEYDATKDTDSVDHDTDRELDLGDHEPTATERDETTGDVRDIIQAVDRLRPSDLPLRSRQVGSDGTGWEKWDPSTYRSSSGNDSLHRPSGEPVFHDHKHGESFGVLSLFAAERGIISKPWKSLSGKWWDAVDAARDAGAPIPEYAGGDDVEHTAVLPHAVRDLTTAASGWDWKHAGQDTDETLSIDDARDRTTAALADAYGTGDRVLVEALPTMGKSYGSIKAAAETDEQVTVLTGRGHKEQYDQFAEWCEEFGLSYARLPSFTRDCDTANGEYGEEWADTVHGWYNRGATPKEIHKSAEYVLDRPLPCQEHQGESCPYAARWAAIDPDEVDVLIGHYAHAHKSKVTQGRTVVFDEFPDAYETTLGAHLQGSVSYWLEATDGVPYDSYTDLIEHRDDQSRRAEALLWFEDHGVEADEGHVFDDPSAHATAPLAVFTILAADDLGNGWERADLGDAGTGLFTDGRDYKDRSARVVLLRSPALEYTSGVVALDGTPTKRMWELALGERLNHRPVLQNEERAEYIRDALNMNFVRTTEYLKPYNSAKHVATDQDAALLERIGDAHDERPSVITTSTAEHEYDSEGVLELVDETKHYGNVLGSNEFGEKRVGAVIGSNHYGDGFIKKWGAFAGRAVERNGEKGAGLSYGSFGDSVLTHMREHETLQGGMRFGRDGNGAVVYVHTNTLPEWVPLAGEGRVVETWSDGLKDVLRALEELGGAPTTAEIVAHEDVDLSRQQVFEHLEGLRKRGVLSRHQDDVDGRRVVWRDDGLHRLDEHGDVELEPVELDDLGDDEVRQLARSSIYTWEFTNLAAETADSPPSSRESPSPPVDQTLGGGDPPPNDT